LLWKSLETLLYEMSVTGATLNSDGGNNKEHDDIKKNIQVKKRRIGEKNEPDDEKQQNQETEGRKKESSVTDELHSLRHRMEHRDKLREKMIKKCRDGQKFAKQAIYALHRNDFARSANLIKECEDCINNELLPLAEEDPPLRSGSFSNVVEEYAEAKLFYAWLLGKQCEGENGNNGAGVTTTADAAKGTLLLPRDFTISMEPEEYLGGLCDLTGEIGRFAVKCGTERDEDGLRLCLETNTLILLSIQTKLLHIPNRVNKKMDQLKRSVQKIERMTYEMSLSRAAGMNMSTEMPKEEDTTGGGGGGIE